VTQRASRPARRQTRRQDAIKLTTSRYFTPSGASIHERGIKPDVVIEDAKDGDDRALHAAVDLLRNPGTIRQSSAN
jgi:C-terminal processing protease CtpA/Prc